MDSQIIKGAFIGIGALLAVVIIGLFVFNYFNQRVAVSDETVNAVVVMSKDGSESLGIVYVDMGELISSVEDEDFQQYFELNKKTLFEGKYKYTASVLQSNGSVKDEEIETDKSQEDFTDGLVIKFQSDLGDKYTFETEDFILN